MALPITVPYTFGNATTAIPLSNLDSDYATVYQAVNGIGNGSVALANVAITGGTISGNTTASNVTVSSGTFTNVTLSNVTISSVSTPITAAEGGTGLTSFTANGVVYASSTSALATGSALTFDGTNGGTTGIWSVGNLASVSGGYVRVNRSDNLTYNEIKYTTGDIFYFNQANGGVYTFNISGSEQMRLTSTGLGIGTSSPAYKLDVSRAASGALARFTGVNNSVSIYTDTTLGGFCDSTGQYGLFNVYSAGSAIATTIYTNNAERLRIDSSGNLLVGTTTAGYANSNSIALLASSGYGIVNHSSGASSGSSYLAFGYNASPIGSISQSGTTAVLYNVTSDYRLKDVIGTVSGHGERIDALEPIDYSMKADGSKHRGFLAHKFQEVYPNSVTGTKDAVDAEGKPIIQQMDASTPEFMADLVAEIQSLRKRLAAAGIA